MKLSIITINYNDAVGLEKTFASLASQTCKEFEHIVVDGGSSDNSVPVIKAYEERLFAVRNNNSTLYPHLKWISEPDKGIYNAMNKGLRMASGDYIQILNAGDILAAPDVTERMLAKLDSLTSHLSPLTEAPVDILYGNMLKAMPDGKIVRDNCGGASAPESFLYFYTGTLNHDCAYIRRSLFAEDQVGLYDEQMKICSDWKWYLDAIALRGIKPIYVDIDVTIFDMNGVSESGGKNKATILKERRDYLEQVLPASVLRDYDRYSFPISQYNRLQRYHLWGLVWILERVLFKLEKWGVLRRN